MRVLALLLALCAAVSTSALSSNDTECIACTLVLALYLQQPNATDPLKASPDGVCADVGLCHNRQCQLFPKGTWPVKPLPPGAGAQPPSSTHDAAAVGTATSPDSAALLAAAAAFASRRTGSGRGGGRLGLGLRGAKVEGEGWPDPCGFNLTCIVDRIGTQHVPLLDEDGDGFAPASEWLFFLTKGLRGRHWRGVDCDDHDAEAQPGRNSSDALADTNCNGISGMMPNRSVVTEKSWEHELCAGTAPRGVVVLGDSASAHFHIPPALLSPANWSLAALGGLIRVTDEFDLPQCSTATGFANYSTSGESGNATNDACPPTKFTRSELKGGGSIYQRLLRRNGCNFNDFQNIAVNGARAGAMAGNIVEGMSRFANRSKPLLVILALIGDDVCNGHAGTASMTTPDAFRASTNKTLAYLDTVLPRGSHVLIVGLADGRLLYDIMHTERHPIGTPYPAFYDYLNCLEVNPCWGWLNSNGTARNETSARARQLNLVYSGLPTSIIERQTSGAQVYKNFRMLYTEPNLAANVQEYMDNGILGDGRQRKDCVEPSDGFHPSQTLQDMLAADLWALLEKEAPAALGGINEQNQRIVACRKDGSCRIK